MRRREAREVKRWKKEFTARLEWIMIERNMDISALVKASGISITSIKRYLNSKDTTVPSAINVKKLAKALGTNSSWLIDFSSSVSPLH